jgi:transcriptional antiterminator RfaH
MSFLPSARTGEGTRWYVAQTRHLSEARAAQELGNQGFEVFLPRYLKKRRHARKVTMVAAPLFPNYLFVAIDRTAQRWRSVNGTIGVVRLIADDDGPVALDGRIVDALRSRLDERGFVEMARRPSFVRGETVRIRAGSFAATLGLFEDFKAQDRVIVLLELLGGRVRVELDEGLIEQAA